MGLINSLSYLSISKLLNDQRVVKWAARSGPLSKPNADDTSVAASIKNQNIVCCFGGEFVAFEFHAWGHGTVLDLADDDVQKSNHF